MIKHVETDEDIMKCFDVMSELRPHLVRANFLATVQRMMMDGYRMIYIEDSENVMAVAGYRISENLFMGKHLYVDDLVTQEDKRSQGFGRQLILWLKEFSIENGCNVLHLDSGTQRHKAHKFYFSQGFSIASYHFSQELD